MYVRELPLSRKLDILHIPMDVCDVVVEEHTLEVTLYDCYFEGTRGYRSSLYGKDVTTDNQTIFSYDVDRPILKQFSVQLPSSLNGGHVRVCSMRTNFYECDFYCLEFERDILVSFLENVPENILTFCHYNVCGNFNLDARDKIEGDLPPPHTYRYAYHHVTQLLTLEYTFTSDITDEQMKFLLESISPLIGQKMDDYIYNGRRSIGNIPSESYETVNSILHAFNIRYACNWLISSAHFTVDDIKSVSL